MTINEKLKAAIPDLVGSLDMNFMANMLLISGNVYTSEKEKFSKTLRSLIDEMYPGTLMSSSLKVNDFVVSHSEHGTQSNSTSESTLDELNVLYYGHMNVSSIVQETKFRHPNISSLDSMDKIDNCVKVLNFITPIILGQDLRVIDGNKRLQLAINNGIRKVLVVIVDDSDKRADFLRLALNRSSEFQKWNYQTVDDYVDKTPQAQPILEPLGFFGRYVLPVSYFSNTVLGYKIDPFNEKQKQYKQEDGLAEWAKYRREQMALESERKRSLKKKKLDENSVSLFDLVPDESNFLETYDVEQEAQDMLSKFEEQAQAITAKSDAIRKKEIEEKGGVWQRAHRGSKEVAEANRAFAIERIEEDPDLTNPQKSAILENIDDFADILDNNEALLERLQNKVSQLMDDSDNSPSVEEQSKTPEVTSIFEEEPITMESNISLPIDDENLDALFSDGPEVSEYTDEMLEEMAYANLFSNNESELPEDVEEILESLEREDDSYQMGTEKMTDRIMDDPMLSNLQKSIILENIQDFADIIDDTRALIERLDGEVPQDFDENKKTAPKIDADVSDFSIPIESVGERPYREEVETLPQVESMRKAVDENPMLSALQKEMIKSSIEDFSDCYTDAFKMIDKLNQKIGDCHAR